jgi:hypothetical protein
MARFSTKVPDPATSHIDVWNNHGETLYRTPLQSFFLIWAWVGAFVFMVIGKTVENKDWWRKIATYKGRKIGS